MIIQNQAAQIVELGSLIKTSDGSRIVSGATVRWCKDGTWADGAGTLSVVETDQYKYAPTQAETNCTSWFISVDHTDAVAPLVLGALTMYSHVGDLVAVQGDPLTANNVTAFFDGNTGYAGGAIKLDTNVAKVGGSTVKQSGGYLQTLDPLEQFVAYSTDNATFGAAVKAAWEGASAKRHLRLDKGIADLGSISSSKIVSPADIAVRGSGRGQTIITNSYDNVGLLAPASNLLVEDLTLRPTTGNTDPLFMVAGNVGSEVTFRRVDFESLGPNSHSALILQFSTGTSTFLFDDCWFGATNASDASNASIVLTGTGGSGHRVIFRNCKQHGLGLYGGNGYSGNVEVIWEGGLQTQYAGAGSLDMNAVSSGASVYFLGTKMKPDQNDTSCHAVNVDATSTAVLLDVEVDRSRLTKATGGILLDYFSPLRPTTFSATAPRTADIATTGEVGLDWSNMKGQTTAQALTNTTVLADVALSQDNIDDIAAGVSESLGVDPFNVDKDHTFTFSNKNQTTASNIITEPIGFNALLAVDFDDQIPKRTSIASVTAATFANITGTEPTVSSSLPSADRRSAHIMVDASAATANTYTLTVTILTADSQTFVRSGRFTVT